MPLSEMKSMCVPAFETQISMVLILIHVSLQKRDIEVGLFATGECLVYFMRDVWHPVIGSDGG